MERSEAGNQLTGLLGRYRALCEAQGAARARGTTLDEARKRELTKLEDALRARLATVGGAPNAAPERPVPATAAPRVAQPDEVARVYCDGACSGNPGPGGYGALVRVPGHPEKALSGGKALTTNNEMELAGALAGLKLALALGADEIVVQSDSEYLVKGMNKWVHTWERNGWRTSAGMAVKNRALWEELVGLTRRGQIRFNWIRGHAGHPENERCDALAVAAAAEARCGLAPGKVR